MAYGILIRRIGFQCEQLGHQQSSGSVCPICGATTTCVHVYQSTIISPTCTEKGYTKYVCSECGYTYTDDEVAATGHKSTTDWSYDDEKHWKSCTVCKQEISEENHNYSSKITAPTCTDKGHTTFTCNSCKYSYQSNEVAATGHSWGTVSYTWLDDGSECTAERICKNDSSHKETADAKITSVEKIPATETEEGTTTYTATFTESWATTQTKDIQDRPLADHVHEWGSATYSWSSDKTACTATRKCIKNTSHVETSKATVTSKVTAEATCTETGTKTYTATFTGVSWATKQNTTDTIPTIEHGYTHVSGTAENCEYYYCSMCERMFSYDVTYTQISAIPSHLWNSTDGTCNICNYICEHPNGLDFVKPGDEEGYPDLGYSDDHYCVCRTCGWFELKPHMYDEQSYTLPTQGYEEIHIATCSGCGYFVTQAHNWNDGVCSDCDYECEHIDSWDEGVCTVCGTICEHSWNNKWNNSVCEVCGLTCEHNEIFGVEYIQNDNSDIEAAGPTHTVKCLFCGCTIEEDCGNVYTVDGVVSWNPNEWTQSSNVTHSAKCSRCSYNYTVDCSGSVARSMDSPFDSDTSKLCHNLDCICGNMAISVEPCTFEIYTDGDKVYGVCSDCGLECHHEWDFADMYEYIEFTPLDGQDEHKVECTLCGSSWNETCEFSRSAGSGNVHPDGHFHRCECGRQDSSKYNEVQDNIHYICCTLCDWKRECGTVVSYADCPDEDYCDGCNVAVINLVG